jgi:hypothetical protein
VSAKAVLLNITASGTLTIHDLADACDDCAATGNPDVHMNFGLVASEDMGRGTGDDHRDRFNRHTATGSLLRKRPRCRRLRRGRCAEMT